MRYHSELEKALSDGGDDDSSYDHQSASALKPERAGFLGSVNDLESDYHYDIDLKSESRAPSSLLVHAAPSSSGAHSPGAPTFLGRSPLE